MKCERRPLGRDGAAVDSRSNQPPDCATLDRARQDRTTQRNELAEAALRYAAMGWAVFPVQERGKSPLIPRRDGGQGCRDGTSDLSQVRRWWTRWPRANVGVHATAFWALDIDGDDGLAALTDLEDSHRWLPVGPAS